MKLINDQCAEIRGQLCEMDSAARRKRAERLRRKEAGYKRVECWLKDDVMGRLDSHCIQTGQDRSEAIASLISDYGAWK